LAARIPTTSHRAYLWSLDATSDGQSMIENGVGAADARQPVHTVYGGANLFAVDTAPRLGALALRSLDEFAPDAETFARAILLTPDVDPDTVYERVRAKLRREPIEDYRLDFEDGYGIRSDAEEDATAVSSAAEVAKGLAAGTLPPFIGIRVKSLSGELASRALRTLEIFLAALLDRAGGRLPPGFAVTLPKIMTVGEVATLADECDRLEQRHGLTAGALRLELMIETPQSILDAEGRCPLLALVRAGRGRVIGAHFGVYDYTASLGITAAQQRVRHPACDLARGIMQVALAGSGVHLSDGATNVMPVGERDTVWRAWRIHVKDVRHALATGYFQGWDLHPAQLPTRYAAVFAFFLAGRDAAAARLRAFVERAARATLVGDVFDDAATGQGLLNFFLRGMGCGAFSTEDVLAAGLTIAELESRSFLAILQGRRAAVPS
jgi:citrate lyase beta subunit